MRNIILRPDAEWRRIAAEPARLSGLVLAYLLPLALIAPLASACRLLITAGASPADWAVRARQTLQLVVGGFMVTPVSVLAMALVIYLVVPLYAGQRSFPASS